MGDDLYKFGTSSSGGTDAIVELAGEGTDTLDFSAMLSAYDSTGINVDLSSTSSNHQVYGSLYFDMSSASELENLIGSSRNDTLTGNSLDNRLEGGLGDDTYRFVGTEDTGTDTIIELADAGADTVDFKELYLGSGVVFDLRTTSPNYQVVDVGGERVTLDLSNSPELENLAGTVYDDTLTGTTDDNVLTGHGGDDTLIGLQGDDTYVFSGSDDLGVDTIVEPVGHGTDTLDFSALAFTTGITLNLADTSSHQQVALDAGKQVGLNWSSAPAVENVIGTVSDDILIGNSLDNNLVGDAGDDVLEGGVGDDTSEGGAGNDRYVFSGTTDLGSDTLVEAYSYYSTANNDTLDFSQLDFGAGVDINLSLNNTLQQVVDNGGQQLALTLQNGTSFENVIGSEYSDHITGNSRANVIEGGGASDTLEGGTGHDVYVYTGTDDPGLDTLTEAAGAGVDTIDFSGSTAGVTFDLLTTPQIENIIGSDYNDVFTSNTLANNLQGGLGDDIYKYSGTDAPAQDTLTEAAGEGTDTIDFSGRTAGVTFDLQTLPEVENILGSEYGDSLTGNAKANVIEGGDGSDTLAGGQGDDIYKYRGIDDPALDTLLEASGEGVDTIDFTGRTTGVAFDLPTTAQVENIIGSDHDDSLTGNALANTIEGRGGSDTLDGGEGDDIFKYAGADELALDTLMEAIGAGADTIDFSGLDSAVAIDLRTYSHIENVVGTSFADSITGNASDNHLAGGAGADWIEGREGIDTLAGGGGTDTYSVIAGEELNVTDIIIDGEAYLVERSDGSTSGAPFILLSNTDSLGQHATEADNSILLATVSDADTSMENLTIHVSGVDAEDISISSAGEITWTPDDDENGNSYDVTITVTDDTSIATVATLVAYVDPGVDSDGDGLSDDLESSIGTDPHDADTDGDQLYDGFEWESSNDVLDPLVPDDRDADPDEDGLSHLDEQIHDTDPGEEDSDGDGVNDGDEVEQGSDANDPTDEGMPPEDDEKVDVRLSIGDASGSDSELYRMVVTDSEGKVVVRHQADDFGEVTPKVFSNFRRGEEYTIVVEWMDTREARPDYDYTALVQVVDSTIPHVVEDPDRLLGTHNESTYDFADGKEAKLYFPVIDLDIDSDNNNGLANPEGSDWEEELEDHDYGLGKLIVEGANTFTPIVLRIGAGAPSLTVRFEFTEATEAGTIKLWTTPQGGRLLSPYQEYTLEELEYENEEIIVYVEGVAENLQLKKLLGVERVNRPDRFIGATLIQGGGSNYIGYDQVKYLVTQEDSFFYRLQFDDPNDGQESQAIRSALASRGVYSRADLRNFSLKPLSSIDLAEINVPGAIATLLSVVNGVPGFNAILYQDYIVGQDKQYILAFAGTDDVDDILDDLWQGLGLYSEQYASAITIGDSLLPLLGKDNIVTTGHSLGGGLASAASRAGGIKAYTFNAAGLHENTEAIIPNPQIASIDAYYIDWDLLSFVQDKTPLIVPEALGTRKKLDGPYDLEAAGALLAGALAIYSGTSWLGFTSGVAEIGTFGLAHRMDVVLYGLLVDEGLPEDILGTDEGGPYDFGIL